MALLKSGPTVGPETTTPSLTPASAVDGSKSNSETGTRKWLLLLLQGDILGLSYTVPSSAIIKAELSTAGN